MGKSFQFSFLNELLSFDDQHDSKFSKYSKKSNINENLKMVSFDEKFKGCDIYFILSVKST